VRSASQAVQLSPMWARLVDTMARIQTRANEKTASASTPAVSRESAKEARISGASQA
jgi:hypothetical protein